MGGNALRSAELVLPGRVVVSSASECRWSVSSSGARFGRCGYRVGGLKILHLPVCRRQGGQRRTNISFARSGSDALVSAGFSTLASLVCPARSFFLALPPTFRPSLIPFQPPAPQDTKKATPFEAACCQGCRGNHRSWQSRMRCVPSYSGRFRAW